MENAPEKLQKIIAETLANAMKIMRTFRVQILWEKHHEPSVGLLINFAD